MTASVLDLFAGCGGLSLGFEQAGFQVIGAVEKDHWAAASYAANHASPILEADLTLLSGSDLVARFKGVEIVVGGPPCQGFSVSGKRQYGVNNPKNQLVHEFVRVVQTLRPKAFVLENVRGLTSAPGIGRGKVLDVVLRDLELAGYQIHHRVLQAADFGIPQYRSRLFVVGTLQTIGDPFPEVTHSSQSDIVLMRYLGVAEAISDLPQVRAAEGTEDRQDYATQAASNYQKQLRTGSSGVYNHVAMRHTARLVERFASIPPGGKSYQIGRSGDEQPSVTVYKSNNQRLVSTLPSLCITANFQSNYIHPTLNRNLTAREAARIQTFPDSFRFMGKRTLMSSTLLASEGRNAENHLSQYNQIGNAVPPRLAYLLARQLGANLGISCADGVEPRGAVATSCL